MQERFDTEMMAERAREIVQDIRASEAYPAILGGIAGGIAGALMATLIASRAARHDPPPASERHAAPSRASFDMRQAVELLAVFAGLVKQVREWYSQERKR